MPCFNMMWHVNTLEHFSVDIENMFNDLTAVTIGFSCNVYTPVLRSSQANFRNDDLRMCYQMSLQ